MDAGKNVWMRARINVWMRARRWVSVLVMCGLAVGTGLQAPAQTAAAGQPSEAGLPSQAGLPSEASANWQHKTEQEIRRSEYQIRRVTGSETDGSEAYSAPNRAHNLRTTFTPQGIRLVPRSFEGETAPWTWALELEGYGTGARLQPAPAAELQAKGSRIAYRRGEVSEWYVSDEDGLRQGFRLTAPPPPAGDGRLRLALAVRGDLRPVIRADGQAVDFLNAKDERVLRYEALRVSDGDGRRLPARFEVEPGRIEILIQASEAVYPVTIEARVTGPDWIVHGDQAGAGFGSAVGTAGDVNGDGYDDVIIGAPWYDTGQENVGRAFVYHGSAAGLSQIPAWTAEGDQAGTYLGSAVATAGDVNGDGYDDVIVGALFSSLNETGEGRAFVYYGSASGLAATPDWMSEGGQPNAGYAASLGTAGDINGDGYDDVIVGAPGYSNGETGEGRAYVYHGSASGLAATPAWVNEGDQAGARFGASLGTAGDINGDGYSDVIVGAPGYSDDQAGEGRAYIYQGSAAGLAATPAWAVEGDREDSRFGLSVSTAGDVNGDGYSDVIVGDWPFYYWPGWRAYLYNGSAGGLAPAPAWTAEGEMLEDDLAYRGFSVGSAGDANGDGYSDVIISAYGMVSYNRSSWAEKAVLIYHGSPSGPTSTPSWKAGGYPAGTAGDVNGDGGNDVIIGTSGTTDGDQIVGAAYVYYIAKYEVEFSCEAVAEIPRLECEALVAIYNSTGGEQWSNNSGWLETNYPSYWVGVSVEGGHVISLGLGWNNLIGDLPPELGNFSALNLLSLSGNQLTSLPPELGKLGNLVYLYLSDNQIRSLPPELGNLRGLNELFLDDNQLTSLPPELANLYSLEWFDLSGNQLTNLPPELSELSVFRLDLSDNLFTSFPPVLWMMRSLSILILSDNQIAGSIPPELENMQWLWFLFLGGNQLTDIPPGMGNLPLLTVLDVSDNRISDIPPELGKLESLEHFFLSGNQLTDIPPELSNIPLLSVLDLSDNQLTDIPTDLGKLSRLRQLYLSGNQFTSIPPWLGNFSSLSHLGFADSQLTNLPEELGHLTNLEWLDLSDNQLTNLPTVLGNLSRLQILYLSSNRLPSLPDWLGNLSNLWNLDLGGNQLSSLPPEIGDLRGLSILDLRNNQLSSLPHEMANLSNLTYLNLSQNEFASLPPELFNLSNLETLEIWSNQLPSLNPGLGNLRNLRALYLGDNQLTSLPPELGNLSSLERLGVVGNRLESLPPELAQLAQLEHMALSNNQINGEIPAWLGNLAQLATLDLSQNQFTGSIPVELGNSTQLTLLRLDQNQLSGDIPASLANLSLLVPGGLDLDYNRLNVPDGYPDPNDPLDSFLMKTDPDWHLRQGFEQTIGTAGGTVASLDGRVTLMIPAGALNEDVLLTFMPQPGPSQPNPDFTFVSSSLRLSAEGGNGDPVTAFNLPATAMIAYTDEEAALIPGEALHLGFWDESLGGWVDAAQTCNPAGEKKHDPQANTLAVDICRLGEFGVFGENPWKIFLPVLDQEH